MPPEGFQRGGVGRAGKNPRRRDAFADLRPMRSHCLLGSVTRPREMRKWADDRPALAIVCSRGSYLASRDLSRLILASGPGRRSEFFDPKARVMPRPF